MVSYSKTLESYSISLSNLADLQYKVYPRFAIDKSAQKTKLLSLVGLKEYFVHQEIFDWFNHDEQSAGDFLRELEKAFEKNHDKSIMISEDTLGEYYSTTNTIIIYEKPCIIISRFLNCELEDLINVVLAHEAAHSVTHLGIDKLNGSWDNYEQALVQDKELFAQIYPFLLFSKPDLDHLRPVFEKLCKNQSNIYNKWKDFKGDKIGNINEELIITRRKVAKIVDRRTPNKDEICNVVNKVKKRGFGNNKSIKKPLGDNTNIPNSEKRTFSNYNLIPSNIPGMCHRILVVNIESGDDVEKRILQAIEHVYTICPGINKYVIFSAEKWDFTAWQCHSSSFQGVGVLLSLHPLGDFELIGLDNCGPLPWEVKSWARKVLSDITIYLNSLYFNEIKNGIIETGFILSRNVSNNLATFYAVLNLRGLKINLSFTLNGRDYIIRIENIAGDNNTFKDLINVIQDAFFFDVDFFNGMAIEARGYFEDYKSIPSVVLKEFEEVLEYLM